MIDFGRSKAYDFTGVEFLSKPITGYLENYHAAARDVVANDITMQRENHLKEIWGPITEELKDLGIQGIRDPSDQFRMFSPEMNEPKYESEANYVLNIMRENESILPGHLKGFTIEGIEEIARARGKAAREHAQEIQSRAQTKGGTAGMILGGLAGHIVDPTMWVGGMVAAPKKAYSLWQLAFYEAMIGAGLGAVQQTSVSQWYKDLGYDYTYKDFVKNVAFDAGAGAVFGVGIKLTADGARAGYRAFKKDGSANPESNAIAEAAQQQQDLEADNPFQGEDLPPAQAEHQARTDAADAAFEDGNLPDIVDEPTLPQVEPKIDSLDGVVFAFKAKDVQVDADRFQFKSGGDEFGVSERLQGVKKWNPDLAGQVLFWEDINGNVFIADGHQRAGLAKRIMVDDPGQDIKLYGRLLREVDGVSAEKAMVTAAHANIANADNMTSVIDAAKILRLDPEGFEKVGLPPNSATVRQARDMMALSDDAFMSVVNGVIPANYGAILGRLIDSPELQEAAIKVLSKTSPKNADEAESIIRQVREVDVVQETQVSLFGDEVITESLYLERARVFSRAKALLLQDKKAFESLSRNADRIEAEGNKLVTNQNKRRADQDAQAIHLLQALANRKGTLSDDLTTAAREAKETGSYAKAARSYADAIRRGIERGDFDGATASDVGRAVYGPPKSAKAEIPEEPSLEGFDEPTGPAAERQADQMAIDMFRTLDEPEAARSPIEEDRVEIEQIRMPIDDDLPPDQVRAQVQALTSENTQIVQRLMKRIDEKFGTESGDNIKDLAKVTQKASRPSILAKKPWHKVSHIRDSYRFKTVIDDIRDVPSIFDELLTSGIRLVKVDTGKLFEPKEWGWRIIAFDLRMPNGQLVEWYLPIKELEAQKKAEGHLLFEEWRNKTPEEILEQNDAYMEAIRKSHKGYDDAFQSALDRMGITREDAAASWSKAESSMLEAARKSPSSSGMITSSTVRGAETQVPSRVRMAEEPLSQKSTARDVPSSISAKSVSGIEDTPTELITDITDDIKTEDFDLEIPVGLLADEDGVLSAATRTMRDIKKDLDAEDAMINRLGVCGL